MLMLVDNIPALMCYICQQDLPPLQPMYVLNTQHEDGYGASSTHLPTKEPCVVLNDSDDNDNHRRTPCARTKFNFYKRQAVVQLSSLPLSLIVLRSN